MIIFSIIIILSLLLGGLIFFLIGQFSFWYNYLVLLALIIGSFIIFTGLYALLLLIFSSFLKSDNEVKKIPKFYSFIVKETAELLLLIMNVHVKVIDGDKLPLEHAVYVSNHISAYDGMVVLKCVKSKPLSVVTKIENLKKPITGNLFHQAGFLHIDRNDEFQAAKCLIKGINFLRKDEASVYICPEGTRNHNPEDLLPYQGGAFKMALKTKKPIVVLALKNTEKIKNNHVIKPTKVYLKVVKVYNYEDYKDTDIDELTVQIRKETLEALKEI